MGQAISKEKALHFRKASSKLLKELIKTALLETSLRSKEAQTELAGLYNIFQRAQELSICMCKKLGKDRERLA